MLRVMVASISNYFFANCASNMMALLKMDVIKKQGRIMQYLGYAVYSMVKTAKVFINPYTSTDGHPSPSYHFPSAVFSII